MTPPEAVPLTMTRMSLHRRVQVAAFTLAMVVAAAIGVTNLVMAVRDLPRTAMTANDTVARLLGSYLDTSLFNRVEELRHLAQSSLVWTALSDSQGRDIYIKPFLEDRNQAMVHGRLALLDYRGRFVAGKASPLAGGEGEAEDLVSEVLASGLITARLAPGDRPVLILGVPIFYVYTDDVIGVLLGSYDLAGLLGRQSVADLVGRGVDLRLADRVWTLWRDAEAATGVYVPASYRVAHAELPGLYALDLQVYSTRNPWLPHLQARAGLMLLVSLLLAAVVWWLAGLAAIRVSGRLEALAAAILANPTGGPDQIPLDTGGDEIAVLSGALRQALSAQEEARRELHQLAYYDPLTGLMNRALFEDKLANALRRCQRRGDSFALLFIDLDRFKLVNDTAGHEAGDLLLQAVAARIRDRIRASDLACRRSGDEFTVLMEPCEAEDLAVQLAEELIQRLSAPCPLPAGTSVTVGASIGIALFPRDGVSAAELMANADAAMYAAKERGAGRCCLYVPGVGRACQPVPVDNAPCTT
jgi:diguanylate cyclase (GGDEF)-like protein